MADLSAWCILISLMLLKPMTPSGRTRAYCTYLEFPAADPCSCLPGAKTGRSTLRELQGGGAEGRDRYGRYFNYLSREDVTEAYRKSGPWEVVSVTESLGGGYDGQQGPWVAVTVRRPG